MTSSFSLMIDKIAATFGQAALLVALPVAAVIMLSQVI
jgi:hypothetical protein